VKPIPDMMIADPRDIATRDRRAVKLALPALMLSLILEEAAGAGSRCAKTCDTA
jgi:hypothetical protein